MKRLIILGMLALTLALTASVASADHSWGKYHWARTSASFNLNLETDHTGNWVNNAGSPVYLGVASLKWSDSVKLDTNVVDNVGTANCDPILGKVRNCNAEYGLTGWLGIAQIWLYVGGGKPQHIAQARVKLNDTYFDTVTYNTPAWRQYVTCQEVGHTFGLGHQNETFDDPNLGTCMDYTNDPDGKVNGQLSNEHPNAHDYTQLVTIYGSHLDKFNSPTGFAEMPAPRSGAHDDEDFGIPAGPKDGKGRHILFEKNLGGGQKLFTWVVWAD